MWQQEMLARVSADAAAHGAVRTLAVGSVAAGSTDRWSDLDALVVAPDGQVSDFWPDSAWLTVDAVTRVPAQDEDSAHIQILLADGHKLDVLVTSASQATGRLARLTNTAPVVTAAGLDRLVDRFVLDAATVLARSARGERLIATHLALALRQYALEAAMIRRDLATGTCVHRSATEHDDVVDRLPSLARGPRPADIVDDVAAAVEFMQEALAGTPAARRFPPAALPAMIDRARAATASRGA
ncbi:MAG: hypothetical protein ACR2F6_05200 [Mycobacteriales bacterium]